MPDMTGQPPSRVVLPAPTPATRSGNNPGQWLLTVVLATMMLALLDWLLARLIWLPLYFGLFFFLIAGLLVGAVSFRMARSARPIPRAQIITGVVLIALASSLVTVVWEYRFVAATAGGERRFPDARNAATDAGRRPAEVEVQAARAFVSALREEYKPGGPIGYVRWAIASGRMELTVDGCRDTVSIEHHGLVWPLRSLAGMLLLGIGLWMSFESLRSPRPVSIVLAPGEEAEEEDLD
jgi:hypothetical protein